MNFRQKISELTGGRKAVAAGKFGITAGKIYMICKNGDSAYKEKIINDIRKMPDDKISKLYKIIHLIISEVTLNGKKVSKRGSLRGIWKGSHIDESVFIEAKKSIFPYEYN